MFQLLLLGYLDLSDSDYDNEFDTKAEELPGGYIIQREIRKAKNGSSFFFNDVETGKAVRCSPVTISDFMYYFKIWENFHFFGLPQGKGWEAERTWLLEFLKVFERLYKAVNIFVENKMAKKGS
jgi:hypothetical protein